MFKFITCFLFLSIPVYSYADTALTHCNENEKIYFNCLIKDLKKVASVCGAGYGDKNRDSGYLQYRFGQIGNEEFRYPSTINNDDMKDRFNFSASRTADYSHYDSALQFSNLNYVYIVYSGEEHKPNGQINHSSSITVWKLAEPCQHDQCRQRAPHAAPEGKIVKVFTCSKPDTGEGKFQKLNDIVHLMSSPGRSIEVTLPYP